jgi:hypothetical protein
VDELKSCVIAVAQSRWASAAGDSSVFGASWPVAGEVMVAQLHGQWAMARRGRSMSRVAVRVAGAAW